MVLFVVSFDTTVDATVDSFAEAAYREALATLLGVDASQIVTVVFAGSVIVQTEVVLYETGAEAIVGDLQQLAEDADASADVFGAAATIDTSSIRSVAVEAPSPPSESPPPETPPSSPSTNDFPWVWVWVAIGAAAIMGVIALVVISSTPRSTKMQYKQPSDQARLEPPKAAATKDANVPASANAANKTNKTTRQLSYGRRSGLAAQQLLRSEASRVSGPYWWFSNP